MSLVVPFARFDCRVEVPERSTGVGFGGAGFVPFTHRFEYRRKFLNGTGANKVGAVFSASYSSDEAVAIDLRGTLVSVVDPSVVVNFPIVTSIIVQNRSLTSGQYLTIGGGSNPFIDWLGATGDALKVGPDGFKALCSPIDGYQTTADTADILTITPATGTIDFDVLILGRAS